MDTNEALKKIEEISKVMESSNRAIFSGERMIVIGIIVALIPVIEWATHSLTFGYDFGNQAPLIIIAIHTVFYWALFTFVGRVLPIKKMVRNELHPLIQKAFTVSKPFMVALIGMIFMLAAIEQYQFIHPIVFILLGFLFSIYGRFSIPAVSYIAWSYIIVGLVCTYLTRFNLPTAWIYFTTYNGLSLVAMGYFLRRARVTA